MAVRVLRLGRAVSAGTNRKRMERRFEGGPPRGSQVRRTRAARPASTHRSVVASFRAATSEGARTPHRRRKRCARAAVIVRSAGWLCRRHFAVASTTRRRRRAASPAPPRSPSAGAGDRGGRSGRARTRLDRLAARRQIPSGGGAFARGRGGLASNICVVEDDEIDRPADGLAQAIDRVGAVTAHAASFARLAM